MVRAKFNVIRPLRLLNLPALESVLESGSLLDPEFIKRREQAAFLSTLTRRIVDPVLPGEDDFSYIPAQVIAEYLADPSRFNLDGILYPSVQLPGADQDERYNIVLFHKASRVAFMKLSVKDDCMIRYGHQYVEDDWETDIRVTEVISAQKTPSSQADRHDLSDLSLPDDRRALSLEIDIDSISVHGIRAVRFEYSNYAVRRSKYHCTPQIPAPEVCVSTPWETASGMDDSPF